MVVVVTKTLLEALSSSAKVNIREVLPPAPTIDNTDPLFKFNIFEINICTSLSIYLKYIKAINMPIYIMNYFTINL
ncbi:hypothetical protein UT300018_11290 [Clostridium faecium]